MKRDWNLEASRLLTEACRHARGPTMVPRAICPLCLSSALAAVYEAGRADERALRAAPSPGEEPR
jgi:hypothetical protein